MVDADLEAHGLEPVGEGKKILEEHFGDWHRWDTGVSAVIRSAGNGID
jgi:GDPmannose 4,6-dehydratase